MKYIDVDKILENIFDQLTQYEQEVVKTYFTFKKLGRSSPGFQQTEIKKIIKKYRPEIYEEE